MKTCIKITRLAFPVRLEQYGASGLFRVVYGKQVKRGLSYGQAAFELGKSIMHALACDGKLDNSERRRHDDTLDGT